GPCRSARLAGIGALARYPGANPCRAPDGGAPVPNAGHAAHRRAGGYVALGPRAPGNPPRALRALRPAGGRAEPPVTRDAVGGVSLEVDPLSAASAAPRETSSVLPPIDPALAPPRPGPGKRLVRVLVLIVSVGIFIRVLWMADLRNVAHLLAE